MSLKLVVTTNVNGDVFELILTQSRYRVGRRHDNDLRIKESYVSAYHSELLRTEDGGYELKDCGSSNGTYLNGVKVEGQQRIKAGDFIKFGILKVAVREHGEDGPKGGPDSGPTIVSLKDRPVFAKKSNDVTSSISPNGKTGRIGKVDGSAAVAPTTGPTPVETISRGPAPAEEEEPDSGAPQAKRGSDRSEVRSTGEAPAVREISPPLPEMKVAEPISGDLEKLKAEKAAIESRFSKLEETVQSLEREKDELEKRLAEADKQAEEMAREKIEALEAKLQASESSNRDKESGFAETSSKLAATLALVTSLESSQSDLEQELADFRKSVSSAEQEAAAAREDAVTAREELAEAEEQKERLRKRLEEVSGNNGQLQAELNRETAGSAQLREELEASKQTVMDLRADLEAHRREIESRTEELAAKEKEFARNESEQVVRLKRELEEARSEKSVAEENANRILKEKLALGGSFERLQEQLQSLEAKKSEIEKNEEILLHDKEDLARRLEKAEASNSELAAKIKEEQTNVISHRNLVAKLETQLRENESQAADREKKRVAALEAELKKGEKEKDAALLQVKKLDEKLIAVLAAKSAAEETIESLREERTQLGSERNSTSDLLREAEKERASLASALEDQKQLAAERERTIGERIAEIAALKKRFEENEDALISRHQAEREALHSEIHEERTAREELYRLLENTRAGMSDAIRAGREQAEAERVNLLTEGHRKLSEVEAELGRVIHAREAVEAARDNLEDELNEREERIEKLTEEIEDLQLRLRDENENHSSLADQLAKTREGLSAALHLNRRGLEKAQSALLEERESNESLRSDLSEAETRIAELGRELEEATRKHEKEVADWESRYDQLRKEKLTLAGEDANLKRIREQIREAQQERKKIESELHKLKEGHQTSETRFQSLRDQREALLREREELKAELNAARAELEQSQKRQLQAEDRRKKLSESIASAEKRIASLQKLESEIEHAVERKRKQGILSRSEIFSDTAFDLGTNGGEFSREDFYRKLINKLDLIDDLSRRYGNRWRYPRVAEQLTLLKSSFLDFLHDHSVKEFNLEPGTVLSVEERKRIKLVPQKESASKKSASSASPANRQRSKVVSTIRPGYVYRDGNRDVIIRKAEVIVA